MASWASERTNTAAASLTRVKPAHAPAANTPAIALDLTPLLATYRKHGRLALRFEQMPQTSRLSCGRNNGNGSWSVDSNEIGDLKYHPAEGAAGDHSLSVRVVGLDEDGATLVLLNIPVAINQREMSGSAFMPFKSGLRSATQPDDDWAADIALDTDALQHLQDELTTAKNDLADRDALFFEMRAQIANGEDEREILLTEVARLQTGAATIPDGNALQSLQDELTAAKTDLANRDDMLAEARKATGDETGQLRAELATATLTIAGHDEALAGFRKTVAQAEERWRKEARDALAKAKSDWDKAVMSQLAAVEAETRTESDAALAAMEARLRKSEAALAYIRAHAPETGTPHREMAEAADLRAQLAALQKIFEEREREFAKIRVMPGENLLHVRDDRITLQNEAAARPGLDVKPNRSRHILFDLGVVAVVSIAAMFLLPRFEAFLPESWAYEIDSEILSIETMLGLQPLVDASAPAAAPSPTPSTGDLHKAVVVRTAKLHAGPGLTEAVAATLQIGANVGILERRGNWTHIQVTGKNGQSKKGWVYTSFLNTSGKVDGLRTR